MGLQIDDLLLIKDQRVMEDCPNKSVTHDCTAFLQTVPPAERMSRERLIEIANSYFTGLANQTGRFTAPFAETCERWENGNHTTNQKPNPNIRQGGIDILSMGCEEQQKTGWFAFVTEIRNRLLRFKYTLIIKHEKRNSNYRTFSLTWSVYF